MYIGYIKNNTGILHSITSKGINDITTSWLSWQSVALDSRGREFDSHRRPWSSIFRNWSRFSLRKFTHAPSKYPYYLPLLVFERKMAILFLMPLEKIVLISTLYNIDSSFECMHIYYSNSRNRNFENTLDLLLFVLSIELNDEFGVYRVI